MAKKKVLFISLITFMVIGAFVVMILGPSNIMNKLKQASGDSPTYSMDIVYDGDHYKLNHAIVHEDDHVYLSLPDLKDIALLDVKHNKEDITITNQQEKLIYKNELVQNSSAKKDEISAYIVKNDIIYIPDRHIEKFLGLKVDDYLDKKTATISLMSASEQQKEVHDKGIGSTIFLHKENVPLAKYEPRSGIYLGGYVLQDEYIDTSMEQFNRLSGKKHASYFKYVGYGKPFPKEWVNEVIAAGGFPQIAWEPNDGLEAVKDDKYLRQFAKDAAKANVPVLLRYASEMNGTWTAYSGKPDLYIEKWRLVHDVMEAEAPNVMMLWNVFTMPENTIDDFYPGDDYVDYVGVNIYNVVYHNDTLEEKSDFEDPLLLLDYVYNTYSHKKPIVIGEFGATNYTVTDGLYHIDFAVEKINRMYKYLPKLYPRVKFIYYFDVNNLVNAPEGRKINNYAISENGRITNAYASNVIRDKYLTNVEENPSNNETYSYRDFFFHYNGELFVDTQFVEDYLKMDIKEKDKQSYVVSYKGERFSIESESLAIDKAAFFEKRKINGISVDDILDKFNLEHTYENGNLHIFQ